MSGPRESDIGWARYILAIAEGHYTAKPVYTRGAFYFYLKDLGIWSSIPDDAVAQRVVQPFNGYCYKLGDKDKVLSLNTNRVSALVTAIRREVYSTDFFDTVPFGICVANGFVGLDTTTGGITFAPHHHEQKSLQRLGCVYDPEAKAPLLERFLASCFDGDKDGDAKRALLQEFVGVALLGVAPRHSKALVIIGQAGTGKSTYLHVVQSLFAGGKSSVAPTHMDNEYYRAALANVRLNAVSEMPKADIVAGEGFKAIVTGDEVIGRHPRGRPFTFHPQAAHLMAGNELPHVADTSDGFWDRVIVIRFGRKFRGTVNEEKGLKNRIVSEELSGVLRWALEGAVRVTKQDGFTPVASDAEEKAAWRLESDQVRHWHQARLIEGGDSGVWVGIHTLYEDYKEWAKTHGRQLVSQNTFERRVKAILGQPVDRANGIQSWCVQFRPYVTILEEPGPSVN